MERVWGEAGVVRYYMAAKSHIHVRSDYHSARRLGRYRSCGLKKLPASLCEAGCVGFDYRLIGQQRPTREPADHLAVLSESDFIDVYTNYLHQIIGHCHLIALSVERIARRTARPLRIIR